MLFYAILADKTACGISDPRHELSFRAAFAFLEATNVRQRGLVRISKEVIHTKALHRLAKHRSLG